MNVSQARHLTFDFVNDDFVAVTKRKSHRSATKNVDNSEHGVTAIENNNVIRIENDESTAM